MRTFYVTCIWVWQALFALCPAQNYKPFQDSTLYSYGRFMSIKVEDRRDYPTHTSYTLIDQALGQGGGDHYQFKILPNHWLGKEVIEYKNARGSMGFITRGDDTLLIKYAAKPGESWEVTKLTSGGYLRGIVTMVDYDSLMKGTLADSLKYIEFQAYDQLNLPATHAWNGQKIILSKNFGLFNFIHLAEFPQFETHPLFNCSLSGYDSGTIEHGYKDLTFRDIFDYQPGMELHFREASGNINSGSTVEKLEAWHINQVTWLNPDSVRLEYDLFFKNYPTSANPILYYYGTRGKIISSKHPDNQMVTKHPGQMNLTLLQYPGKIEVAFNFPNFSTDSTGKQIGNPFLIRDSLNYEMGVANGSKGKEYQKGLGMTRDYFYDCDSWDFRRLVYYKRGNVTWGDPHTLVSREKPQSNPFDLSLYPNPATEQTHLVFNLPAPARTSVSIYSIEGKRLVQNNLGLLSKGKQRVQLPLSLSPGLYFIQVESQGRYSREKLIIR